MRWKKLIVWTMAVPAAAAVLLAAGAGFLVGTESGLRLGVAVANRILAGRVEIAEAEGSLAREARFGRIELHDADGVWLSAAALRLRWSLDAALEGRLGIDEAAAGEVVVRRRPVGRGPAPEEGGRLWLPPIPVTVDRFTLGRIRLAEAVVGQPATLTGTGRLDLAQPGGDARLVAEFSRIDTEARASVRLGRDVAADRIDLHLVATEPAGGLIARLLRIPGLPALAFEVKGGGRREDFAAHLVAVAGDSVDFSGDFRLRRDGDRLAAEAEGEGALAGLLAPRYRPLARGRMRLALAAARADGSDVLVLDRLRLDGPALAVEATGTADLASGALDLTIDASGEVAPVAGVAGLPGAGRFALDADVVGTRRRPEARYRLKAEGAVLGAASAETVSTRGTAVLADGILRLDGTATTAGAALHKRPPPVAGGDLAIAYRTAVALDSRVIGLERVEVAGGGVTAVIRGEVGPGGVLDLAIQGGLADLAAFRAVPFRLGGRARAEARLTGSGDEGYRISGTARLAALAIDQPLLAALAGPAPEIAFAAVVAPDLSVEVESLTARGRAATVTGKGRLLDRFARLDAELDVRFPDLALLGEPAGRALQGAAAGKVRLTGAPAAPDLDVAADWTGLVVDRIRSPRGSGRLRLAGLASVPRGTVSLEGGVAGLALAAAADLEIGADRVSLDRLRLTGPGFEAAGGLAIGRADRLLAGELRGRVADLAPYAALFDRRASGAVDLTASFAPKDGGQTVLLRLAGQGLGLADGRVTARRGEAELRLRDLFADRRGTATVSLSDTAVAGRVVGKVVLDAEIQGAAADFTLRAGTAQSRDLAIAASGKAAWAGGIRRLTVARLDGFVAGHPVALRAPVAFRQGAGLLALEGLDLAVGGGHLRLSAEHGPGRVGGKLSAVGLPLAVFAPTLHGVAARGAIDAEAELGGRPDRPVGSLRLRLRDLRATGDLADGLPPLGATLDAALGSGRLDLDGSITGLPGTRAALDAKLPLAADLAAWRVELPATGPLYARLDLVSDLAELAKLFAVGGDRMAGRLDLGIRVGGTVAAPIIEGKGGLGQGRYESATTGAVLREVSFALQGDGERVVLRDLRARDSRAGKLTGQGSLVFAEDGRPGVDISIDFDQFRVAQLDEVRARASGRLNLAGGLGDLLLHGKLRVDNADIRIPKRLPASVVVIPVTEVNAPPGHGPAVHGAAGETPPGLGKLAPKDVRLDIEVALPGRVFVRGRGLDSEWAGDLLVGGTLAAPRLLGALDTVRGSFTLASRRFDFSRGRIRLFESRGHAFDADIDVQATAEAGDVTAELLVTGRLMNPRVQLGSSPVLPQDEVLSRLLFGSDVGRLNAIQAIQLGQAALELSGAIDSGEMITEIRRSLGLDVLDIDSSGGAAGLGGTTVRAGKYLTDKVFVGVKQGLGSDSSAATVEYHLLPNVSVESSVGAGAEGDIGISYEKRY